VAGACVSVMWRRLAQTPSQTQRTSECKKFRIGKIEIDSLSKSYFFSTSNRHIGGGITKPRDLWCDLPILF
jgi:hypothetical protein